MATLDVNGKHVTVDVPADTPLLWTLRDELGLTGTKFGCGMALCGACTAHLDGAPIRSCVTPISAAVGKKVTTIEAIDATPLGQRIVAAWRSLNVPQCGYCQSGQIMQAAGLLARTPKPTDHDIDEAMAGNICRCGTYQRIRAAIRPRHERPEMLELLGPARYVDAGAHYQNYGDDLSIYPIDTARLRSVVELVAEKSQWGRRVPAGHGLGIAVHRSFVTYVAIVVEAAVAEDGTVAVPRVDMAVDCGFVAYPDRVHSQLEGTAVMALSSALYGAVTFKNGRAQQHNFNDFPVARMNVAPRETRVHIVDSDAPPGGVGEPGVPPFAPALCNAIFAATGKRIRRLPIANQLGG